MPTIQQFVEQDTFAQHLGIELLDASAGYARVRLTITDKHLNGLRTVHGGVIFTLADVAFAIASNAHGLVAMAINAHISYLKAVTEGTLVAEAQETSLNPKLATYTVSVSNEQGDAIAIFQGMVYRKRA
jgi:acyl-CoA thioesterase